MTTFQAASLTAAKRYCGDKPYVIISISDPADPVPLFQHNPANHLDTLYIQMEDIENAKAMTSDQANAILDFVLKWKETVDVILIHCYYGISRSPAVRDALSLIFNNSPTPKMAHENESARNPHIFKTVLKAAVNKGLIHKSWLTRA